MVTLNPLKSAPVVSDHANDVLQRHLNFDLNNNNTDYALELLQSMSLNNSLGGNGTENGTVTGEFDEVSLPEAIFLGLILGLMILITVIGNAFVIAAILLERNLQNVANYLIVSLAVADLMVACLVMPLGAVYEISNGWHMGKEVCDMWTSSDVLCCTASILHLVAIAVDRYWAVTNVDYIHTRNSNRIGGMIVVIWSVALVVSLPPQFGWRDEEYLDRLKKNICVPSQDMGYQIFATCSTFYVPLLVILILYWKIFQTARKRIHRRREQRALVADSSTPKINNNSSTGVSKHFLKKRKFLQMKKCNSKKKSSAAEALVSSLVMVEGHSTTTVDVVEEAEEKVSLARPGEETTAFTISKGAVSSLQNNASHTAAPVSNNVSPEKSSATTTNNGSASHQSHMSDISRVEILAKDGATQQVEQSATLATIEKQLPSQRRDTKKESLEAKRERKAAKTLAIITGAFVMCWLPFFVMALVTSLCNINDFDQRVASVFLWLGYFNSTLNPVIYTIFSPEFRQAFKRILCGAHSGRRGKSNFRSGKIR